MNELRAKLSIAKDIEEVKAMLGEVGEAVLAEYAERIWEEIEFHRSGEKRKLDKNELDAVTGGYNRNWIDDGCAATCEKTGLFWLNDLCYAFSVTYDESHSACINGGRHDYRFVGVNSFNNVTKRKYKCSVCGAVNEV